MTFHGINWLIDKKMQIKFKIIAVYTSTHKMKCFYDTICKMDISHESFPLISHWYKCIIASSCCNVTKNCYLCT